MNQVLSQAHAAQPQALDVMFSRDKGAGHEDQSAAGICNVHTNLDRHFALLYLQNQ